jgi:hypothetical protein
MLLQKIRDSANSLQVLLDCREITQVLAEGDEREEDVRVLSECLRRLRQMQAAAALQDFQEMSNDNPPR